MFTLFTASFLIEDFISEYTDSFVSDECLNAKNNFFFHSFAWIF